MTTNSVAVLKVEDLAKSKAGFGGDEIALHQSEMAECQCCGRLIRKVHHMASGHKLGSECAAWLQHPVYRIGRKPARKLAAFAAALGITW